jgi:hypothetical protein
MKERRRARQKEAARGGGSPARHGKGAPGHENKCGLILHEAKKVAKLSKGTRGWLGRRRQHHAGCGGRCKADVRRGVLRLGVK